MKELGALLKQAREEQGTTIAEIAEKTKIREKYLQAIELGDEEVLPDPVYVRGFLRSYAKVLGIDWDEVLRLYEQDDEVEVPKNQTSLLERRRAIRRRKRIRFVIVLGIIIVTIAVWFYFNK